MSPWSRFWWIINSSDLRKKKKKIRTSCKLEVSNYQLLGSNLRRGQEQSIKIQKYAKRGKRVVWKPTFTHIFFKIQYLVHKLLALIARFFVSFIQIPVLLCLFVFLWLNWTVEFRLKKAAFMRIDIWICIKTSTLILVTA